MLRKLPELHNGKEGGGALNLVAEITSAAQWRGGGRGPKSCCGNYLSCTIERRGRGPQSCCGNYLSSTMERRGRGPKHVAEITSAAQWRGGGGALNHVAEITSAAQWRGGGRGSKSCTYYLHIHVLGAEGVSGESGTDRQ